MYLLYLDESGNPDDAGDRHFVLGGAAIFERAAYFVSGALDGIQSTRLPGLQPVPFHATEIRAGKGFWRNVIRETRAAILQDMGNKIADTPPPGLFLFSAVIEKTSEMYGENAVRYAAEIVCRSFDRFLGRQFQVFKNPQRGLIVFAESHYQQRHRLWVQDFRRLGTQWGAINNLADVPYFGTPKETRLLQLADLVAHATFLMYERKNVDLVRPFIRRFDQWDGILHGLVHVTPNTATCDCPHCTSLRSPNQLGPWFP